MLYPIDERERAALREQIRRSRLSRPRDPGLPQPGHARPGYRGRGPIGYIRSDRRIFEDVCEALTAAEDIDATEIDVEVERGIVRLSGFVATSREQWRAQDEAESCPGVRHVVNEVHTGWWPHGRR